MNSKQLTNILVKIVGLDLCGHAVPSLCVLVWIQLQNVAGPGMSVPMQVNVLTTSMAQPLISVVLGVFMIIASRVVTNWLFNDEPQEP
jgi:hypothetical protein